MQAFIKAFEKTDAYILDKSRKSRWRDGCTALVALIDLNQHTLWIANVGDSEAVISTRSSPKPLKRGDSFAPTKEKEKLAEKAKEMEKGTPLVHIQALLLSVKHTPYDEIDRIRVCS